MILRAHVAVLCLTLVGLVSGCATNTPAVVLARDAVTTMCRAYLFLEPFVNKNPDLADAGAGGEQ